MDCYRPYDQPLDVCPSMTRMWETGYWTRHLPRNQEEVPVAVDLYQSFLRSCISRFLRSLSALWRQPTGS